MNAKHLNTYVLIVFAVLLSGCFDSNESGFSGTWQDTSGMNIRIEVKENNLLVIHIPQPRSDGRGTTGMDLDIRGSYYPSGNPTTILEQGVYHKCQLENGVLSIDGMPIGGQTFQYTKR